MEGWWANILECSGHEALRADSIVTDYEPGGAFLDLFDTLDTLLDIRVPDDGSILKY